MVVQRLVACARLQQPDGEVERVQQLLQEGDESWQRWLDELERGDAVVATLRVAAHVRLPDGTSRSVEAENHHIWLEVVTHPPLLEGQIQEITSKDCPALAQQLCELGASITADELCRMYVHVELADDLLQAMRQHHSDGTPPEVRLGVGTETGQDARR